MLPPAEIIVPDVSIELNEAVVTDPEASRLNPPQQMLALISMSCTD
jgi:hypothetical protein